MLEVNNLSLLIATQLMSQEWPGSLNSFISAYLGTIFLLTHRLLR